MIAPATSPPDLIAQLPEEWELRLSAWGQPRYRARQVFRWIHQRGELDPARMTDLPQALRTRLAEAGLRPPLQLADEHVSADGTRKLLVQMADGAQVETVLIPRGAVAEQDIYAPPDPGEAPAGTPGRAPAGGLRPAAGGVLPVVTQCVSSQVGCAMGCAFCASGIAGLKRQMTTGEIVAQVLLSRSLLQGQARLAGVVFMGMGEPLHNYAAVQRALRLLNHPDGVALGLRKVTVSTSGLAPQIAQLGRDFGGQVRLAVSLHAADSDTRGRIMPVNKRHPLPELMQALRAYPLPPGRRITVEYTLIDGVNDGTDAAARLCELLSGIPVHVNLIPMNPVPDAELRAPSEAAALAFQAVLRGAGLPTYLRRRKGDDIAAACGQLALHGHARKVRRLPVAPPRA